MVRLPRSQLVAYAVIAAAVLVLGGRWLTQGAGRGAAPAPVAAEPAAAEPTAAGSAGERAQVTQPSRAAVVHVAGAVRRPGVYRLGAGARVRDAVRRAGGATRRADVDAVNLAALLQDGVQVVVPKRVPAGVPVAAAGEGAGVPAAPVNLNAATAEQLETLDGVGPATAAKILDYRKQHGGFRSVEDLGQVSGIGPKRLEALRDDVVV